MSDDGTKWVCNDCGSGLETTALSEWAYMCPGHRPKCQAGWHHAPCSGKTHHGAASVISHGS